MKRRFKRGKIDDSSSSSSSASSRAPTRTKRQVTRVLVANSDSQSTSDEQESNKDKNNVNKPKFHPSIQSYISKKASSLHPRLMNQMTLDKLLEESDVELSEENDISHIPRQQTKASVASTRLTDEEIRRLTVNLEREISNGKIPSQRLTENTAKSKLSSLREQSEKESNKESDEESEHSAEILPMTQKEKNREEKRESMLRYVQEWDDLEQAAVRFVRFPTKRKLSPKELRQLQKKREIRRRKREIKKGTVAKAMRKEYIKTMDELKKKYEDASKRPPRTGKQRYDPKVASIYDQVIEAKHKKADKKAKEWVPLIGMESEQNNVIRNINRVNQDSHLNDVIFCDSQGSSIDSMIERKQKYTKAMQQMMAHESHFSEDLAEAYELDEINEKVRHLEAMQREYENDQMTATNIEKSPLIEDELNKMREQKQKYSAILKKYDAMRVAVSEQLNMRNSSQEMQSQKQQLTDLNMYLKEQLDSKNKFIKSLKKRSTMVAQLNENIASQQTVIDELKQRNTALAKKINAMKAGNEKLPSNKVQLNDEERYLRVDTNGQRQKNAKNVNFDDIPVTIGGDSVNEISEKVHIIGDDRLHKKRLYANSEYLSIGKKRFYYKDIKRLVACSGSETKWMILTNECTIRIKSKSAKARQKLMAFIQSNL